MQRAESGRARARGGRYKEKYARTEIYEHTAEQALFSTQVMQDDTWESHAYRCPICMQIFSEDTTSNMTPLIVCQNIHTVCRACCGALKDQQLRSGNDAKCPQCRIDVWKHEVLNREKIYFLSKSMLVCGSCDSKVAMSCGTAQQHSKECVENHITCPLLNSDVTLSRCTHAMNISGLWEHCQKFHIMEGSPATLQVKAAKAGDNSNNGALTASLSVSMSFDKNNYIFFTVTTEKKSYNLCLHLTKEMPRDSSDPHYNGVANENESVFVVLRRFFPELELTFGTLLLSIEVGSVCGMLLRVPTVISSYEDTTVLKELPPPERRQKIMQVPTALLRQMSASSNTPAGETASIKMILSLQMYFTEI